MQKRGRLPNVSTSPSPPHRSRRRWSCSARSGPTASSSRSACTRMRQAIEEGFILDVLENYTTYKAYWKLLKKVSRRPPVRQEEGERPAPVLRRPARAHDRQEGRDHGRALRRPRPAPDRGQGQGDDRHPLAARTPCATSWPSTSTSRRRATRSRRWSRSRARSRDEGVDYTEAGMNGASRRPRPPRRSSGTSTASWSSPTSSRPGSTSRSCTRCTWTRSSAASTRCRPCPG